MTRCLAVALGSALALGTALPAHAVVASSHHPAEARPGDDGSMCFGVYAMGASAGVATATGVVTTRRLGPHVAALEAQAPTTLVSDVRPLASTVGYGDVCVGGTGLTAIGGSVVFTLQLHSVTGEYAAVVTCRYSDAGPACV